MTISDYIDQLFRVNVEVCRFIEEAPIRKEWKDGLKQKWSDLYYDAVLYGNFEKMGMNDERTHDCGGGGLT